MHSNLHLKFFFAFNFIQYLDWTPSWGLLEYEYIVAFIIFFCLILASPQIELSRSEVLTVKFHLSSFI